MGSRVSSQIDVGRLIEAVRSPGIDTRVWCSLAVAVEDSHFDADHGVFVDLILLPSEQAITARVGSDYAGNDFGNYRGKILKDDEVCVVIPTGAPAEGAIVVSRLWSAADKPPTLASEHQDDQVTVLPEGKAIRTKVSGDSGVVELSMESTLKVLAPTSEVVKLDENGLVLGSSDQQFVALANLVLDRLNAIKSAFDGHTHGAGTFTNSGGGVTGTSGGASNMGPMTSVASSFTKTK